MGNNGTETLYKFTEVAGITGVDLWKLYRAAGEGRLLTYRLGKAGLRIPASEVARILREQGENETADLLVSNNLPTRSVYSILELSKLLGCSGPYVRSLIRNGDISTIITTRENYRGKRRIVAITQEEVERWLATKKILET